MANSTPVNIIASLGSSPAVLTELIWYLVRQEKKIPAHVYVITTAFGAKKFEEPAFQNVLEHLFYILKIGRHTTIYPPIVPAYKGKAMQDINSTEADQAFADTVFDTIKMICTAEDLPLVVSLAGGRKSMSSHMMATMQLLGRPNDRLMHLLVDAPYETLPTFFYPEQETQELTDRSGTAFLAADANIKAINIPYLPLRGLLASIGDESWDRDQWFTKAQDALLLLEQSRQLSTVIFQKKNQIIGIDGIHKQTGIKGFSESIRTLLFALAVGAKALNQYELSYGEMVGETACQAAFAFSMAALSSKDPEKDSLFSAKKDEVFDDNNLGERRSKLCGLFNEKMLDHYSIIPLKIERPTYHYKYDTYVDLRAFQGVEIKLQLNETQKALIDERFIQHRYVAKQSEERKKELLKHLEAFKQQYLR